MILNILGFVLLFISLSLTTTSYRLGMIVAGILGILLTCFSHECNVSQKELDNKTKIEAHDKIMRQIEFTRQLTIPFYL